MNNFDQIKKNVIIIKLIYVYLSNSIVIRDLIQKIGMNYFIMIRQR